ncbi:hypothetical protein VTI74DRAFT_1093 [Chaetomium olivicolor]
MPKQKKATSRKLKKGEREDMEVYLQNANPNHISAPLWGVTKWESTHGETRSTSRFTFHIGLRVDHEGNYLTCILVKTSEGDLPVEGTIVNWGPEPPVLAEVLEYYQNMFLGYYPFDRPGRGNQGGGNGGGGASGSGFGGGWRKDVQQNHYGGYYYIDENDGYQECDASGNPIYTTNSSGHRTGNPRGIVLVFVNSQQQTYYYSHGKAKFCPLKKDSRTGAYYFVDDEGRTRHAQYVGRKPSWMDSKHKSTANSSGAKLTLSSASDSASASASASKTSKPQVFIDKQTGKMYYRGADGRTHWV